MAGPPTSGHNVDAGAGSLRIALVYRAFHLGGSLSRTTVELARHLSGRHEVHVFSIGARTDPRLAPRCTFHDVTVPHLGDGVSFSASELLPFAVRAARLVRDERFDAVHVCNPSTWVGDVLHLPGVARGEAVLQGVPGWRFHAGSIFHPGDAARRIVERRAIHNPHLRGIHVAAQRVRDDLVHLHGISPEQISVVPPGVNLDEFKPAADREHARAQIGVVGAGRVVLLFCGSDFARKGLDLAIEALAAAATDAELLVVGSGPGQRRFEALARNRGVADRVRFLGGRVDASRIYQAADVLLLPTRADIWGVTPVEAMACGIPSIVSATAGSAQAVREAEAGIVLEAPLDVRELREAIERLASDEDLRRAMGRAGIAGARPYSWASRGQRVEEALVAVADTRNRERPASTRRPGRLRPRPHDRLRIALVYRSFAHTGSLPRFSVELARHLSRRHEVHVFSIADRTDASLIPGCIVHPVGVSTLGGPHGFSARELLSFARSAARLVRAERFDVVHVRAPSTWVGDVLHLPGIARGEAELQGLSRSRFAATTLRHPGNAARLLIEKRALANPTLRRIHVDAPSVREDLIRLYGAAPDDIVVVTPGVDLDVFRPSDDRPGLRAELGIDPGSFVVGFCGHDFRRKGLDRAIAAVAAADSAPILLVVGSAHAESLYRQQASALGVADRVRFLGAMPDTQRLYQAADVFLLPTTADVWGATVVEAMACGTPPIVTRAAGASAAVRSGTTGVVLSEPFDPDELRRAIDDLAAAPARLAAMRAAAFADAREHGWDARGRTVEAELLAVAEGDYAPIRRRRRLRPSPTPSSAQQ